MNSARKTAVVAGVFFIIAAAAAVAGLVLYGPVLSDPRYIVTASGGDARVLLGAFFEVILAIAVIGTAVTLFPVIRRQSEGIALGYVAGRNGLASEAGTCSATICRLCEMITSTTMVAT